MENNLIKKILILTLSILLFFSFSTSCLANDLAGRFGLGLGYPYLSLKYGLTSHLSIEALGVLDKDKEVKVYGGRLCYHFNPKNNIVIFMGLEGNTIKFNLNKEEAKEKISGQGHMVYFFIGQEFFIRDNFTFSFDIGPSQIVLSEDKFDLDIKGLEWIYNLGINFYFGKARGKKN